MISNQPCNQRSYQPWEVLLESRTRDDPGQASLTEQAELSFVCVAGLVWSTWDIFKTGLCCQLQLTRT